MNTEVNLKIWSGVLRFSIAWLVIVALVMLYDSYLMWFADSRLELLQPNHRTKTVLLTFPMLAIFYLARFKSKSKPQL